MLPGFIKDDDDEVTHLLQEKNIQLKSKIGKLEKLLQTRQKELQHIQQVLTSISVSTLHL